MNDYSKMTTEEFDRILAEIVKENADKLLSVPGAYEVFSEHYNNEVLDRWDEMQKAKEHGVEGEINLNMRRLSKAMYGLQIKKEDR